MTLKRILKPLDMEEWRLCKAHSLLVSFVERVNSAIAGMKLSQAPTTKVFIIKSDFIDD
jgi:hypothetical protein